MLQRADSQIGVWRLTTFFEATSNNGRMPDEMDFDAYVPKPRDPMPRAWSWPRTIAIAAALVVHAALGLRVTLPPSGSDLIPRAPAVQDRPAMALVLIDTPEPLATPESARPSMRDARAPTTPPGRPVRPAMTAVFRDPESTDPESPVASVPSAVRLEAQLPDLARSLSGPTGARPNGTLPALPGSAVAVVPLHAPVKRWKQVTPEQVGNVLAALFVSTMAANPDDFEKARDGRDPLREMTEAHLNSFNEPDCADPADPLRDRRCWDDNPNLRR